MKLPKTTPAFWWGVGAALAGIVWKLSAKYDEETKKRKAFDHAEDFKFPEIR